VFILTPNYAWLMQNDPQALEQARLALGLTTGPETARISEGLPRGPHDIEETRCNDLIQIVTASAIRTRSIPQAAGTATDPEARR
jgi:hypothetical protein